MARISLCVLLLSAALGFSQQQPQSQDPPTAATANPSGNNAASPQDHSQRQSKADVNQRIQSSIADLLSSDPILSGADVEASVNDVSIILTGTVQSYAQHQRVLQLAAQYSRWRKIDDKIKMQ
ncbi:MAG TPA: BON domain-containing protein [Candidatus Angelobacter sp.]|jgi:osmotically-inducible protein OsmY|nr:BON domain-containing protein [Candidatus Angelobacter sp.]